MNKKMSCEIGWILIRQDEYGNPIMIQSPN